MRAQALLFALALVASAVLLLGIQAPLPDKRSLHELWNAGHIALFWLLSFFACRLFAAALGPVDFRKLFAGALFATLLIGGATEYLQSWVGRESSAQDLLLNLAGAALGCCCMALFELHQSRRTGDINRWLSATRFAGPFLFVTLCATLAALAPLWLALVDERRAARQFPVLVEYRYRSEMGRHIANAQTRFADGALLARFSTERYSHVSWNYLARDWSGYRALVISLDNRAGGPVSMTCRVHDFAHESNYLHYDRFNRRFELEPGSAQLLIELDEVRSAPRDREMDMRNIASLICFTGARKPAALVAFDRITLQGRR